MNSERIWNLLPKFYSGEASSQEREFVNKWRKESEDNQKVFELVQEIWFCESESRSLKELDIDKIWLETRSKLRTEDLGSIKPTQQMDSKRKEGWNIRVGEYSKYAAVATVLLISTLVGIFLYPFKEESFSGNLVYKTEIGEILKLVLEDSSRVWLAPESTINVLPGFNANTREIQLEGEAFFIVESNQEKPFLVYAQNSITKVLGTQFNVTAYDGENSLAVLVKEGTVAVEKGEHDQNEGDIILRRGDLLQGDEQLETYEVKRGVRTSYLKWTEGLISFEDLQLVEILERLEHWYPVEIVLKNEKLAHMNLTAEFNSSQSLEEILDAISLALNIKYKLNQKTVIIYE